MNLPEYILLAFSSLFFIIDPIATVPAFLAMTPTDSPAHRIAMARLACFICAVVLLLFSITGNLIFRFLGITMPAFEIAGSIVLLLVALDMLRARRSAVQQTSEETDAGTEKEDIAVTPLAIPMLAGPGALSTTILLNNQARTFAHQVALYICIVLVCFVTYIILRVSAHGARWLNPIVMRITSRIMGLLLAAVSIQFMLNALRDIGWITVPK